MKETGSLEPLKEKNLIRTADQRGGPGPFSAGRNSDLIWVGRNQGTLSCHSDISSVPESPGVNQLLSWLQGEETLDPPPRHLNRKSLG